MNGYIKLGIYAAAGFGTYEILRRTGALQKAGQWLNEQVPDDVKAQIKDHVDQAKQQLGQQYEQVKNQAQEQYGQLRTKAQDGYGAARERAQQVAGQAGQQFDHAKEVVTSKFGGGSGGQRPTSDNAGMQPPVQEEADSAHSTDAQVAGPTITGPGRGADDVTADINGGTVHHRVGRGVIHG